MLLFLLHKIFLPNKGVRKLNNKERVLLNELIRRSGWKLLSDWEQDLLVTEKDGITGSLLLYPKGVKEQKRILGIQAAKCQFQDLDGVDVIAVLNLDNHGNLFELDLWKTDFTKVKEISEVFSSVSLDYI